MAGSRGDWSVCVLGHVVTLETDDLVFRHCTFTLDLEGYRHFIPTSATCDAPHVLGRGRSTDFATPLLCIDRIHTAHNLASSVDSSTQMVPSQLRRVPGLVQSARRRIVVLPPAFATRRGASLGARSDADRTRTRTSYFSLVRCTLRM